MKDDLKTRAEARLDAALAESAFEDPRPAFRERLRYLREQQPAAFGAALSYHEETLVPTVGSDGADPLSAWLEYGRRLGELSGPGETMAVDASGRAWPYSSELQPDTLVIHLPADTAVPALPIAVPRNLSRAQKATLELLVQGARAPSASPPG